MEFEFEEDKRQRKSNWIKEHFDTLAIVASIAAATWAIKSDIHTEVVRLENQVHDVDKRLTSIETIMLMHGFPIKACSADKEYNDKARTS